VILHLLVGDIERDHIFRVFGDLMLNLRFSHLASTLDEKKSLVAYRRGFETIEEK
jgi:hypothetical protein